MKIGYDAKRAFLNRTGLGNYSRWLIRAMAGHHPDHSYYLYTPKLKAGSAGFLQGLQNIITKLPASKLFESLWRSRGIVADLKRDGIELYHGLSHELPFGIKNSGIKTVVTVHDVIIRRYPQYFSLINRTIYWAKLKYACAVADHIVAISAQTRYDLMELLSVSASKITVIYQGCDPTFKARFSPAQKSAIIKKYQLPPRFILNVGTIEARKNLLLVVKSLLYIPDIDLVVIGKPTNYLDEVNSFININSLASRVHFLKDVPFTDLPAIYQLATAFVYPSRYEGFGIPILEALNSGTPVVAATGSCLEEAGGPDSLYVHPDDDAGLAQQIIKVMDDAELRKRMINGGFHYIQNFTDEKLSEQLNTLYQNTIDHA